MNNIIAITLSTIILRHYYYRLILCLQTGLDVTSKMAHINDTE